MGFVTSALYSQMAVAQQFNAQAALIWRIIKNPTKALPANV